MAGENYSYCAIRNIPAKFRSMDLRCFFSDFVEAGLFNGIRESNLCGAILHSIRLIRAIIEW